MNDNIRNPPPFRTIQPHVPMGSPSWTLVEPKPDYLGRFLIAACVLVIFGVCAGIYLSQAPDDYHRIRNACPGKSVDVWSRDGAELLAIRCELQEPRT